MSVGVPRRIRLAAVVTAVFLGVSLSACSSFSGSSAPSIELRADGQAVSALPDGAADLQTIDAEQSEPVASNAEARSTISTGGITIEVDDPAAAVEHVTEVAQKLGGYVESQNVIASGSGSTATASLSLRIPSEQFSDALVELGDLGRVIDQNQAATDVTAQHVDLQARVEALETSVTRLTELMAGAANTSELLEAEAALSARQAELDGLNAQLSALEDQIDEATIWVSLTTESVLPGGPANFWEGLLAGLSSLTAAGAGALVLLGILIPWIVIAAIITLLVVVLVRSKKKSKKKREMRARLEPELPTSEPQTTDTPAAAQQGAASQTPPVTPGE